MGQQVTGATPAQRQWILARDDHRCQFHVVIDGKWIRCKNTAELQVHHIVARHFAMVHYSPTFPVNGCANLISLCREHHVGYRVEYQDRFYVVHYDTEIARLAYHTDPKSYEKMRHERDRLCDLGHAYWNTKWDWMFHRIVQRLNVAFLRQNAYPSGGIRGKTGRLFGVRS